MTRSSGPWRSTDLVMSGVFQVVALGAIAAAWRWASRSQSDDTQLDALVLASGALLAAGVANLALVVNARRSIAQRTAVLIEATRPPDDA